MIWLVIIFLLIIFPVVREIFNMSLKETVSNWGFLADTYKGRLRLSLILGVIHQESRGNPEAKNTRSGATGLMQITAPVVSDYNVKAGDNLVLMPDMFEPQKNIKVGCFYLNWLFEHYGSGTNSDLSEPDIIRAYNWGIGNVLKYRQGKRTDIPIEALDYPNLVLAWTAQVENLT